MFTSCFRSSVLTPKLNRCLKRTFFRRTVKSRFDSGRISVTDECEILVADAPARNGYAEFMELEGDRLRLPDGEDKKPHSLFLEAHRRQYRFE